MKRLHKKSGCARRGLRLLCALWAALSLSLPCMAEGQSQEIPELLEPVGVKMDTAAAYIGDLSSISVYDGSIIPYVEELYFEKEGVVAEVHVILGQEVKAGDVLITLEHESQDERLESLTREIEVLQTNGAYADALAEIDMRMLEVELRALMTQSPVDKQAVELKKLDIEEFQLELELDVALREMELQRLQDELANLEEQMGQNELIAPFDGRIMYGLQLVKGSYVTAYNPVLYLADDTRLSIQSDYVSASITDECYAVFALIGANRYELTPIPLDTSEYITRVLAGETVMSDFSINAPDDSYSVGQYAAVCIETQHIEDALLIPSNALYSDATGRYVYVIQDDERVRQNVRTGLATDWETQIVEGLEEGAIVYVKN